MKNIIDTTLIEATLYGGGAAAAVFPGHFTHEGAVPPMQWPWPWRKPRSQSSVFLEDFVSAPARAGGARVVVVNAAGHKYLFTTADRRRLSLSPGALTTGVSGK